MVLKNVHLVSNCCYTVSGLTRVFKEISPSNFNFNFRSELINFNGVNNSKSNAIDHLINSLTYSGSNVEIVHLTKNDCISTIRKKLRLTLFSPHTSDEDAEIIKGLSSEEIHTLLLMMKDLNDYNLSKISVPSFVSLSIKDSLYLKFRRKLKKENIFLKTLCVIFMS